MFDFETTLLPGGIAVVRAEGKMDDSNRTYFFECVSDLINDGYGAIVVDCEGLGNVSSSDLGGLVRARSHVQSKGGTIYLTHVNAMIVDILNMTKLNQILAIYPTTNELLEKLKSQTPAGDGIAEVTIEPNAAD